YGDEGGRVHPRRHRRVRIERAGHFCDRRHQLVSRQTQAHPVGISRRRVDGAKGLSLRLSGQAAGLPIHDLIDEPAEEARRGVRLTSSPDERSEIRESCKLRGSAWPATNPGSADLSAWRRGSDEIVRTEDVPVAGNRGVWHAAFRRDSQTIHLPGVNLPAVVAPEDVALAITVEVADVLDVVIVGNRGVRDAAFGFDPQAIHLPDVDLPASWRQKMSLFPSPSKSPTPWMCQSLGTAAWTTPPSPLFPSPSPSQTYTCPL